MKQRNRLYINVRKGAVFADGALAVVGVLLALMVIGVAYALK
jgi:hypothetical protein